MLERVLFPFKRPGSSRPLTYEDIETKARPDRRRPAERNHGAGRRQDIPVLGAEAASPLRAQQPVRRNGPDEAARPGSACLPMESWRAIYRQLSTETDPFSKIVALLVTTEEAQGKKWERCGGTG